MAGIIHGILIIFGIAGIFSLFKNDENNLADLAEREANAHSQIIKQLGEELKNATLANQELLEENKKYREALLMLKKLNGGNINTVRVLRKAISNNQITIAPVKNKNTKRKLQANFLPNDSTIIEEGK